MMQTESRVLDDIARLATSAAGTLTGVREEVQLRLRDQLERLLRDMDLVTREEFEVVQAMAEKARQEQEAMSQRLEALEAILRAEGKLPSQDS